MYFLDSAQAPIVSQAPIEFTNTSGVRVTLKDFALPTADRIAVGIWSLETDERPDESQLVVTGAIYEKRDSIVIRHWATRPMTEQEIAGLQKAADAAQAETVKVQFTAAVQEMLDTRVRQRNYDDIASACTYDGDPDPVFSAEGAACKAWRSAVWRRCYDNLAKIQTGEMPWPTVQAFLADLPALSWPGEEG